MTRTLLTAAILFICAAALALGSDDGYLRTEPVANLTISTTGTEVLLSWDAVPDATAYKVYSCSTPDGAFSEDLNGVFNGASWTVPITAAREFYHVTALIDPGTMVFVAGGTIYPTTGTYTGGLTVASFYVDKHEITQAAFTAVMGSNPAEYYGVGDTYPVYNVPWYSAVEYCNRRSLLEGLDPCYSYLGSGTNPDNWPPGWDYNYNNHTNISCDFNANGYRLPTEAEWEYAARGGLLTNHYTYSGGNNLWYVGWYGSNSGYESHPVGLKDPNELGIYDMSGNVAEWCWDICSTTRRVVRGGSFDVSTSGCTVWAEDFGEATSIIYYFGFRVCRNAP